MDGVLFLGFCYGRKICFIVYVIFVSGSKRYEEEVVFFCDMCD